MHPNRRQRVPPSLHQPTLMPRAPWWGIRWSRGCEKRVYLSHCYLTLILGLGEGLRVRLLVYSVNSVELKLLAVFCSQWSSSRIVLSVGSFLDRQPFQCSDSLLSCTASSNDTSSSCYCLRLLASAISSCAALFALLEPRRCAA